MIFSVTTGLGRQRFLVAVANRPAHLHWLRHQSPRACQAARSCERRPHRGFRHREAHCTGRGTGSQCRNRRRDAIRRHSHGSALKLAVQACCQRVGAHNRAEKPLQASPFTNKLDQFSRFELDLNESRARPSRYRWSCTPCRHIAEGDSLATDISIHPG